MMLHNQVLTQDERKEESETQPPPNLTQKSRIKRLSMVLGARRTQQDERKEEAEAHPTPTDLNLTQKSRIKRLSMVLGARRNSLPPTEEGPPGPPPPKPSHIPDRFVYQNGKWREPEVRLGSVPEDEMSYLFSNPAD